MTQSYCVGELLENLVSECDIILIHINIKQIQSVQFQVALEIPNVRVLQIDFAKSYSCQYQNEMESALWCHQSVMFFSAALTCKSVCKTYLIVSYSHDKGKDTAVVFADFLYNHFDDPGAVHDIIIRV